MFGWGKKKEAKEIKIESNSEPAPIVEPKDIFPIGVYVAVGEDINAAESEISLKLANFSFLKETAKEAQDNMIAITLMGSEANDDIWAQIRHSAHDIASALRDTHQLYLVKTDKAGTALETLLIEPPEPEEEIAPDEAAKKGLFDGLKRTSAKIGDGLTSIFTKAKLDDDALEELEELLIMSDMGVETARKITAEIATRKFEKGATPDAIRAELADIIANMLEPYEKHENPWQGYARPRVIMFVGVNGSGKTTTIGKISQNLVDNGHSIMLAAADTFRAAASEQLLVWGERANVPVIAKESGADAAGLAFEALQKAKSENKDILLIDTAGRLQNKVELMAELEKIIRVIHKLDDSAPHETWLVLDATVGQNALSQAEAFIKAANVTGLIMSKLDGTAKGGVLLALTQKYSLPVYFIGVGEKVTDLQPFNAKEFAKALVGV